MPDSADMQIMEVKMMYKTPMTKKQKKIQAIKRKLLHIGLWFLGFVAAIFLGIFIVVFFGTRVVVIDASMSSVLEKEDVVLMNTLSYVLGTPHRFDVVAIKVGSAENSPTYVRRVVGLPGETIQIIDGILYVDGEALELTFSDALFEDAGVAEDALILEEDEYFVICDDYNNYRNDSRMESFGTVSSSQIKGCVWLCVSPMSSFGLIK